jgi:hypothetical protein
MSVERTEWRVDDQVTHHVSPASPAALSPRSTTTKRPNAQQASLLPTAVATVTFATNPRRRQMQCQSPTHRMWSTCGGLASSK